MFIEEQKFEMKEKSYERYRYGNQKETEKTIEKMVRVYDFDCWGELLKFAQERTPARPEIQTSRENGRERWGGNWHGTKTWEEAVDLAINGWEEGREKANMLAEAMTEKISSLIERQDILFDVTGQAFDIGLVLEGVPECWYHTESQIVEGHGVRQLKLVFNACVSGGISTEVMMRRGAIAAALVKCLELAGFRVEVSLATAIGNDYCGLPRWVFRTVLKEASQPLDIDRMVFSLAHPASFRRIQFALMEADKELMEKHGSSYGHVSEIPKEMRGDIYIGSSILGGAQWDSDESAKEWILKELQRQGVKLSESE